MRPEYFVFDNNVLISAFLFKTSIPRQALDLALARGKVLHSDETLHKLWEVLVRPKFDRYLSLAERTALLEAFERISLHAIISENVQMCRDPKDDKFLSLAQSAEANCITSGDQDLLVLTGVSPIPIFSPARFLEYYHSQ